MLLLNSKLYLNEYRKLSINSFSEIEQYLILFELISYEFINEDCFNNDKTTNILKNI